MLADFYSFLYYLISNFSYLGIFLASFLANATILLPISSHVLTFIAAGFLDPWLVGLVSALGATLGESVGYTLGYGVNKAMARKGKSLKKWKNKKWMKYLRKWTFLLIFVFAATPLPDDVAGIYSGAINYSFPKFFLACFLGKIVLYVLIALGGYNMFSYFL